jgi:hypothetical protein
MLAGTRLGSLIWALVAGAGAVVGGELTVWLDTG